MLACENSISLTVPGRGDYMLVVRTALGGVGVLMGLDIDLLDDLRGAAEEACDCLRHQPLKAEQLTITCTLQQGVLETVVEARLSDEAQSAQETDMEMTLGILETLIPKVSMYREGDCVNRIVLQLPLPAAGDLK